MKKNLLGLVTAGWIAISATGIGAAENFEGLRLWAGVGTQSGDVRFEESVTALSHYRVEFDVPDVYYTFGARYQFIHTTVPQLSLQYKVSIARDESGKMSEDFRLGGVSGPVGSAFAELQDIDWTSHDVQVGWTFAKSRTTPSFIEAIGGYTHTKYDFDIENYTTTVPVHQVFASDFGSYHTKFHGWFFGLGGETWFNDHISLYGHAKYYPDIKGRSTGEWELTDVGFKHRGKGDGYEAAIGLTILPKEHWAIGIQVAQVKQDLNEKSGDGVNNYVLSNGVSLGSNNLDRLAIDTVNSEIRVTHFFS